MVSVTLSDHLLRLVLWFSLAMLLLALSLLVQIVWLRINLKVRTARERRFQEIWRPLMLATIIGTPPTPQSLQKGDELFFLKLWNHLHELLRGNATERLNAFAAHYGMSQHARTLLRKKNLGMRLLALNTLGNLKDTSAWNEILGLAQLPDPLLSLAAARALFQIDDSAALRNLKQQLLEREDWPPSQLAILIQEAGSNIAFAELTDAAVSLADSTDPADLARLKRLLHLLEVAPYQPVISAIRRILAVATDDEIVAQCLRFLREPDDLPSVRDHLGHPSWVVRLHAVSALGRIGTVQDLPQFASLLSDPVWWVRYRTAQAAVSLARHDNQLLSELRARLTDRYALDMLEMVMAESESP